MDGDTDAQECGPDLESRAGVVGGQGRVGDRRAGDGIDAAEPGGDGGVVTEAATADEEVSESCAEPLEAAQRSAPARDRTDQVHAAVFLEVAETVLGEPVVAVPDPVGVLIGILEIEHIGARDVGIQDSILLVSVRQIVTVRIDGEELALRRRHAACDSRHGDGDLASPVI